MSKILNCFIGSVIDGVSYPRGLVPFLSARGAATRWQCGLKTMTYLTDNEQTTCNLALFFFEFQLGGQRTTY